MENLKRILIATVLLALPLSTLADNDDDDDEGHRHHHYNHHDNHYKHERYKHDDYRKTYWDGQCKVTVKYKKHGEYVEKRKCNPPRQVYYEPAYVPAPPAAPVIYYPPGVSIHGRVNLPY